MARDALDTLGLPDGYDGTPLGPVLVTQLDAAMGVDPDDDVDELVRAGEFDPIAVRLRDHGHGQHHATDDLIEEATGESFTADHFVDYAKEKFGALYSVRADS